MGTYVIYDIMYVMRWLGPQCTVTGLVCTSLMMGLTQCM